MIVGGAKSAELGQHLRADGLAGVLQVAHRRVDPCQALARVAQADRQRRVHVGDLVAERAALGVGAYRDRHHRLEHQIASVS